MFDIGRTSLRLWVKKIGYFIITIIHFEKILPKIIDGEILRIITSKGLELDYYDVIEKSKNLSCSIYNIPKIYALCCWSKEKIDYIFCYEAAQILDIPFIPLPSSIEFSYVKSLIQSLPFAVAVYKDNNIIPFNNTHTHLVSDWLQLARLCFFTSGSTGDKKLVFLSDNNISTAVSSIQEKLKYSHTDRVINFLPMAFDYGFYQYLLVKNIDATICLIDEGMSISSVSFIDKFDASILPIVPSMVTALIPLFRTRFNGDSIKKITSTGEAISTGLINQIIDLFHKTEFYTMYGLTECKRVSILLPDDKPDFPGSVGQAISCARIAIDNPDSQGRGEIIVSGSNVALGTLSFMPSGEIIRKNFNGTLNTGDLGFTDSKGFLYVEGRRDSQIKILGQRTSTVEIENAALSIPGVITCKASADASGCYLQCISNNTITIQYIRQSLIKQLGTIATKIAITISTRLDMTANYKSKRPE
ncbi:AMP-binding protein [Photorhabdus asymbiotica]|uniref:AMP-binding protein n=1 Tax=Photorhabdus asymbiotica TaxID=291112 RepID=UPI003DA79DE7